MLFLENYPTFYNDKSTILDFFLQLCSVRGSFQRFLETSSTIVLAVVLDALLGYRDGN